MGAGDLGPKGEGTAAGFCIVARADPQNIQEAGRGVAKQSEKSAKPPCQSWPCSPLSKLSTDLLTGEHRGDRDLSETSGLKAVCS